MIWTIVINVFIGLVAIGLLMKMDENPIWALIPIVNLYIICRHVFSCGWFALIGIIPKISTIFVFIVVLRVFMGFGNSVGKSIVLAIFAPITMPIYAFNSANFRDP